VRVTTPAVVNLTTGTVKFAAMVAVVVDGLAAFDAHDGIGNWGSHDLAGRTVMKNHVLGRLSRGDNLASPTGDSYLFFRVIDFKA
jgi:hypothetical protein